MHICKELSQANHRYINTGVHVFMDDLPRATTWKWYNQELNF